MKKFDQLIDFLIKTFCTVNLWIIIFIYTIRVLNFFNPPLLIDQFYRPAAAWPERFEMLLYLFLSFIFVLAIRISTKIQTTFNTYGILKSSLAKFAVLIFLIACFSQMLGSYPMALEFYPFAERPDKVIYNFIYILYLGFVIFFVIETLLLNKLFSNRSWWKYILYGTVTLVTAILIFEPRFPFSAHEYGYFLAPIWEVVKGKTLFLNVSTDYGFYATLFFASLYKLGLFNFSQLPIYVWIFFVIQYFLSFYLIYKISRSLGLALLGLFSIITINYFSFFVLPMTITQYSALRRISSIVLLFLLYKTKRLDSPILYMLFSLFCFWIVDTGIAMIIALGLSTFYLYILKSNETRTFLKTTLYLVFFVTTAFLLINLLHVLFSYSAINPFDILKSLRQHAGSGLTMLPIAEKTYFWIVIAVYFASIFLAFREKGVTFISQFLILSANLTLTNSLYFVGRSQDANLFDISILVLLNLFILIGSMWKSIPSRFFKNIIGFGIFLILIAYPAYQRHIHLTEFILYKLNGIQSRLAFKSEMDQIINQHLSKDAKLIRQHIKTPSALILSREDTYLLILSDKKNLLDVNPQSGIDTVSEMTFATMNAGKICPQTIAGDCELFNKCPKYESLSSKSLFMAPHVLKEIEFSCNTTYRPISCTDHLCIAQSAK